MIACDTAASFNLHRPLPPELYAGVPSPTAPVVALVQLLILEVNSPLVINSVGFKKKTQSPLYAY